MFEIVFKYLNKYETNEELVSELLSLNNEDLVDLINTIKGMENSDGNVIRITQMLLDNEVYKNEVVKFNLEDKMFYALKYWDYKRVIEITWDEFDKMVDIKIKNDDIESVYRLAYVYSFLFEDLEKIEDYLISKKDYNYIIDYLLIKGIDQESMINKIKNNCNDIIPLVLLNDKLKSVLSEKDYNLLIEN